LAFRGCSLASIDECPRESLSGNADGDDLFV
jgi:hypothetical protein